MNNREECFLFMSLRKFYLVITSILLVFLFLSGTIMLNYLKTYSASDITEDSSNNFFKDAMKHFVINQEPINVLVLVGDKWESNTDTMILVNFDPTTYELNILSIPRDTKVILDNNKAVKINSIFVNKGGDVLLMKILSDMLGIDIQHYIYFNIETFRKIIDLLGGVWVDVPVDLDYDDPIQDLHIHLKKGRQLLDGEKAEQYLRFRHPNAYYSNELMQYYDGSDIKRIEAQQNFIKELIDQKLNIAYISKLNDIVDTVFENLKTNISLSEIMNWVSGFNIKSFSMDKVHTYILPGYAADSTPWYYICDEEKTKELINNNFSLKK